MRRLALVPLTVAIDFWMFFHAEMRERRYARRDRW